MKKKRKKKEDRRKFNFYHSLVLDVDDRFELFFFTHTGRESHVDSDVDGWKA